MAKDNNSTPTQPGREGVISIIGPGMRVVGDCATEGTLRIEGSVEGTVRAGKAVVLGKDGVVDGDITTQDAVIGGRVTGSIVAESRLELQATCSVEGQIHARRIKLEEGGHVDGTVKIGEVPGEPASRRRQASAGEKAAGEKAAEEEAPEAGEQRAVGSGH